MICVHTNSNRGTDIIATGSLMSAFGVYLE